jgi:hypothetical protein
MSTVIIQNVEKTVEQAAVELDQRLQAVEATVKTAVVADYAKVVAFIDKAKTYVKSAGGISAVLAAGFAAAKYDVVGFVLKHIL